MVKPTISFIIPYYNSGLTIVETLNSIYNQTYKNFDIWIVNDGSTDENSLEILKDIENSHSVTILHQENEGPSIARNRAIVQSKSDYIVPLDADDLIFNNAIDLAMEKMELNNDVGIVYGDIVFFGSKNELKKQCFVNIDKQLIFNQLAVTALIRRSVFNEVGLYDEVLSKPGLEDWEFWMRVEQSKWKFKSIENPFLKVRVSSSSRTYTQANNNLEFIKNYVYRKHNKILYNRFEKMYYNRKQFLETPDYRIGNFLLKPYRLIKSIFNR
jgi:glycosyltransferase involved in cell wall biosynthesis